MKNRSPHAPGVTRRPLRRALCAVVLLSFALAARADAQRATITIDVLEPSRALAKLATGEPDSLNGAVNVIGAAFRHDDSTEVALVKGNYDAYTGSQRQTLLDGVERIARGELQGEEHRVRRSITTAFEIMGTIGLDPAVTAPEKRQIPGRVLRILRQSEAPQSRGLAVYLLGDLLRDEPPEAPAIIAELVAIASAPFSPERPHPQIAVDALINGGDVSIPALRRLNDTNAVQDYNTRVFLREHARRGYPLIRQGVGRVRSLRP